ncbi:MAG TPA: hypothetical protein PK331_11170 [Gordonia sp. (in: high G+C Gram-positive bacteria)]|uniref:hypothetical protein n=1 Tax=unclassified Gordonia (in: high G+C Gram-positive bacteria) TaxID=2657482 RepID=UPI000FB3FC06|nr:MULTISPECIES: hypothetical protein [unclassified Gordonia (in: high G+C Gram-positive bacteria)]RUP37611.1 MAG: hypothetical protein EKK60_11815 [Gordonia sp. (in: high G+C Gram-positive bacteria)]HNP58497.1 hypothetical protein [Gordonia sp. (in: high G+C Gram-positive bacteria)]HRC51462.1 hypothetical protein [Gordonia sp. (in: high G+C Gram-positive bacteria)]
MTTNSPTRLRWTDLVQLGSPPIHGIAELPGSLADVVGLIESVIGRRSHSSRRRVPSAGLGYPYEILLATDDFDALAVVDLAQRNVRTADPDRFRDTDEGYVCLLVGRPWLSMRKYGPRGYLYHLIDSGHALFDLALLGSQTDDPPVTIPPSARDRIHGKVLGIGRIRLRQSATSLPCWRLVVTDAHQMQVGRTAFEELALNIVPQSSTPVPVVFDTSGSLDVRACLDALQVRTSASTFIRAPHPGISTAIDDGLAWGRAMIAQLGLPEPGVTVVGGPDCATPIPQGDLLAALAGQYHLVDAQAFLVFSVGAGEADHIDDGRQALLLAIGVVGQAVYLAAAAKGVGVTGVGGISPEFWNAALPQGQHALYLMALGTAAPHADKPDALMQGGHP